MWSSTLCLFIFSYILIFHVVIYFSNSSHFRNMNFKNVKTPQMPGGGATSALIKLGVIGGLGLYGAMNSLYNVEGGHRAIVFNRLGGIKEKVLISPCFFCI